MCLLVLKMQPQVKKAIVLCVMHHSSFCENANWTSIWLVSDAPLQHLYLIIPSSSQWFQRAHLHFHV